MRFFSHSVNLNEIFGRKMDKSLNILLENNLSINQNYSIFYSEQVNSIEYTVHVGRDMWSHVVIAAPKATTFWYQLTVTSSMSGQRYMVYRPEPSDMIFRERSLWSVYILGMVDQRDEAAGLGELMAAVKNFNPGTFKYVYKITVE